MNKKIVGVAAIVLFCMVVIWATLSVSMVPLFPRANRTNQNFTSLPNTTVFSQSMLNRLPYEMMVIPVIAFIGLAVGAAGYHFLSERGGSQPVNKKEFRDALLSTLTPSERDVVALLLENNGSIPQYELTRLSGRNKVQTHRLLSKMERAGTITKKRIGKINKIELKRALRMLI